MTTFAQFLSINLLKFVKIPLLEEFTTEMCTNCPSAAEAIHNALSVGKNSNEVAPLCHHSGYHEDQFTQQCDRYMLWLYGDDGTYAPALMLDRKCYYSDGTAHGASPYNGKTTMITAMIAI